MQKAIREMVSRIMTPLWCLSTYSGNLWMYYLIWCGQRDLVNLIKLRSLRWGDYTGLSSLAYSHHRSGRFKPFLAMIRGQGWEDEEVGEIRCAKSSQPPSFRGRGRGLWSERCKWLLEAKNHRETDLLKVGASECILPVGPRSGPSHSRCSTKHIDSLQESQRRSYL